MHILITDVSDKQYIVKKSDIRRIYTTINGKTVILFHGNKNTPITISGSVEDFFNIHLSK